MSHEDPIINAVGKEAFLWLSRGFNSATRLSDIPGDILERLANVDISIRNYSTDPNSITCIALITFAYRLGNKAQIPQNGSKDILLVKVLAKNEKKRRAGEKELHNQCWTMSLFEMITGKLGDHIRAMSTLNSPFDSHGHHPDHFDKGEPL